MSCRRNIIVTGGAGFIGSHVVRLFVNKYPGITHNYEREGEYNLWFTLLTPDDEVRQKIMDEITSLPGVEKYMDLSARRKYKINVQFMLK